MQHCSPPLCEASSRSEAPQPIGKIYSEYIVSDSASITVRQCTALRQENLAGGGLADWRTDSAKNAALADWADWVHGPGVGPRWAEI